MRFREILFEIILITRASVTFAIEPLFEAMIHYTVGGHPHSVKQVGF